MRLVEVKGLGADTRIIERRRYVGLDLRTARKIAARLLERCNRVEFHDTTGCFAGVSRGASPGEVVWTDTPWR